MTDLKGRLERLGLAQYLQAFVDEGFDSWEIIVDITESDLTSLHVKLGHRRKLQRAIAEWRGQPIEAPLPTPRRKGSVDGSYRSDDSANEGKSQLNRDLQGAAAPVSTKRKYRRHPKPDENAPERPSSAYVIFSNQTREALRGQDLSFADIAKIVGERWQVLSPASREACDKQAAAAKERYYQELAEYKKTPQYTQYQEYLADFKAKHSNPSGREEGKRSKVETDAGAQFQHGPIAVDRTERFPTRPSDSAASRSDHNRSTSADQHDDSSAVGPYAPPSNVSPTPRSFTSVNASHGQESLPPMSVTGAPSSAAFRESPHVPSHSHDLRGRTMELGPRTLPYQSTAGSPPSSAYQSQYDSPYDLHARRRAPALKRADSSAPSVPSLAHTDTTTSSLSGTSRHGSSFGGTSLPSLSSKESIMSHPFVDASMSHRVLPPIPSSSTSISPLEPLSSGLPTRLASPATSAEARSGLSALLMASELVRNDDRSPLPDDRPP